MSERVSFRGGLTCSCVAESLPYVEADMLDKGLIKSHIDIYQLGYRGDVEASAGTHDAGGNTDVGQYSTAQIAVWRDWGWTMQNRSPFFTNNNHAHGWPYGCPHLANGAQYQVADWDRRRNGLASHGPVQGPWPVENWKTALERHDMLNADDVTRALVKALGADDQVDNYVTGNPDNKRIAPTTAIAYIGKRVVALQNDNDKLNAKLDQILARLPKEPSA